MKKACNHDLCLYEVVDRTAVIMEQFTEVIHDHQAIHDHPELKPLADECAASLMALYQRSSGVLYKSGRDPRAFKPTDEQLSGKLGE